MHDLDRLASIFLENQQKTLKFQRKDLLKFFFQIRSDFSKHNQVFQTKIKNLGLNKRDLLVILRSFEYVNQFKWILYTIMSCNYNQAYREMRFLMEAWIKSLYLDHKYPLKTLSDKLEQGEVGIYGTKLIDKTFPCMEFKSNIKRINEMLSQYIHGNKAEMERYIIEQHPVVGTIPRYREREYKKCIDQLKQIHDIIMQIFSSL
ncbi:MAG: hypothetical protein ACXADY_02930 [Candidatus Hodarchaeales archaeon]|jgi:hypothetical protein